MKMLDSALYVVALDDDSLLIAGTGYVANNPRSYIMKFSALGQRGGAAELRAGVVRRGSGSGRNVRESR